MSALLPSATDRLALSRQCLRQAMHDIATPHGKTANEGIGGLSSAWRDTLKSLPGASIVIDALSSWWAQHPLRLASLLAAQGLNAVVQPMAQRNPIGLVLGALLLGGLLAWSRPWRLLVKPAILGGLLPQLLLKAVAQMPLQSWMAAWTSMAQRKCQPKEPAQPAG